MLSRMGSSCFAMFCSFLSLIQANLLVENDRSNFAVKPRIVGGSNAIRGELPYQGYVLHDNFTCGCSLLSSRWVITAAHCTHDVAAAELRIFFGEVDLSNFGNNSYIVRRIHQHSSFNASDPNLRNDISLLEIDGEVELGENVASIALPSPTEIAWSGLLCTISGWGSLSENDVETQNVLQKAQVPVLNNTYCEELYNSKNHKIFPEQICAGYVEGGYDSCQGDSGGPLACRTSSRSLVLHGVTSYGEGCGRPDRPGIYTRITSYVQWIEEKMRNDAESALKVAKMKSQIGLFFIITCSVIYSMQK